MTIHDLKKMQPGCFFVRFDDSKSWSIMLYGLTLDGTAEGVRYVYFSENINPPLKVEPGNELLSKILGHVAEYARFESTNAYKRYKAIDGLHDAFSDFLETVETENA